MINFSFSSVLITVLVSNLLLIAISLCFRSRNLLMSIGYKLLFVFCIVTLVRFLFPLELPFTKTIVFPEAISFVAVAVVHPHGEFRGIRLSIWTGFCLIWISGTLVLTVRFIRQHIQLRNYVRRAGKVLTEEEPYAALLAELCTEKQRKRIQIIKVAGVESPMLIGLRNPQILLPENADPYSQETLYALRHEICHYAHHDLWLKSAVNMIVIAYWWNPFSHMLNRQVDALLEMRVDNAMISKSAEATESYIGSLLYYAQKNDSKIKAARLAAVLFSGRRSTLNYRIHMMRRKKDNVNHLVNAAIFTLVISVYILSYLFIFEGAYMPPEIADAYMVPSQSNGYAIINEDGLYDVYMGDGFFLETTDTLVHFPNDMEIYSSKEDYNEKKP